MKPAHPLPNKQDAGLTLMEVLVVVAIIALITALAVKTLPRYNANPTNSRLPERLTSQLEAAHTQAYAERVTVTLTGQDDFLLVDGPEGREQINFQNARVAGRITIDAAGNSLGNLTLNAPGMSCTKLSLNDAGIGVKGEC